MKRHRVFTVIGIVFFVFALTISSRATASNESGVATGEDELSLVLALDATTSAEDPDSGCIASAETKRGTIFPAGDLDAYTFYGQVGQGVVIEMADNSGSLYPRLQLYDPNRVLVKDTWVHDVARIENYQLNMTGIYTIVASGVVSTGEYGLSLVLVPGATTSPQDPNGGDIASGETKIGNIFPGGDLDAFAFYGQADQGVVIEMADNSRSLYPRLQLYDPNGVLVKDTWVHDVARIENYQLKMTGIYTIVASGVVSTGEYGLTLQLIQPSDPYGLYPYGPQPSDGQSISYCDPHQPYDIVIQNKILPDGSVVKRRSGGYFLSWWSVIGATGYDVYLASGPCMPMEKLAENIIDPWVAMPALEGNKVYYWQVVARTPAGDIRGPTWWFATEPCPWSLTLSAIGRGTITDPGVGVYRYSCEEVVPVTAVADPNFEFVRWEGTAVDANKVVPEYQNPTGSKILVTVDGAYTLTAVFEEVVYDSPLDSNPGWSMNGQWEFGVPKGKGCEYGNPDPNSGRTGSNVIGVNLNGCYNTDVRGPYSVVSESFDLRGYKDVKLRFWRWLNTDEPRYVSATVDVSIDEKKTWCTLWESETEITDSRWILIERPLGPEADGQPAVYLRWSYQVLRERAYPYSGWNLDDIQLIGSRH